jgi:hypothetical protein
MAAGGAVKHYFVDEAGDLTLFDKEGGIVVGNEGVSRYFMIGLVELPDPDAAHRTLEKRRKRLVADPYFSSAPSMQPARKKTAVYFHAKDDLPEVKYEVIKLLPSLGAKATIAVKRKERLAKLHRPVGDGKVKRVAPNTVYDELVTEIFRGNLPLGSKINLVFATRGRRERREALQEALAKARASAGGKRGKKLDPPITVSFARPPESAGLQIVDYYLWAVQRMYETGTEQRFFRALEPQYTKVMDLDDKRNSPCGERYSGANKLRPQRIAR